MTTKKHSWCNMEKGGVNNKNIHTAFYSAIVFAFIFIFTHIINDWLNKYHFEKFTHHFLSWFIHFILIIIISTFIIFIFKTIYNIGDKLHKCN